MIKMILKLTKVQLGSAMEFMLLFSKGRKKEKNTNILAILMILGILFAALSGMYSYALGTSFQMFGQLSMLPEFMMTAVCMITLIATIYKVKGTLFGTKDYDILMSLPIPTTYIVASRILLLYWVNFFFSAILMLPNMIVYGYLAQPEPGFYLRSLLALVFLPLIPMGIASFIGILTAAIASKFRHSNFVNIVLFLILFFAVMSFSFQMQQVSAAEATNTLTKQIEKIYPFAGMYFHGVVEGTLSQLGAFLGMSAGAFLIFCLIIGKLFLKLNTSITGVKTRSNYKIKEQKRSTPFQALFNKESKRVFSSTIYFINSCISMIIMTIGVFALVLLRPKQFTQILQVPEMAEKVREMIPFLFSILAGMTFSAACSISLEGRSLWILRSAPIGIKTIFKSKLAVNLILILPLLVINTILIGSFLKFSLFDFLITFFIPALYAGVVSIGGLLLNLKFPLLDWTNETVVIKQSAASMLTSFSGMLLGVIPLLFLIVFQVPIQWLFAGTALIMGLLTLLLWRVLMTWGIKRFQTL